MKRKKHYNEFQAVKLARKLMERDEEEDESDEDRGDAQPAKGSVEKMEDEQPDNGCAEEPAKE